MGGGGGLVIFFKDMGGGLQFSYQQKADAH